MEGRHLDSLRLMRGALRLMPTSPMAHQESHAFPCTTPSKSLEQYGHRPQASFPCTLPSESLRATLIPKPASQTFSLLIACATAPTFLVLLSTRAAGLRPRPSLHYQGLIGESCCRTWLSYSFNLRTKVP